LGEQLVAKIPRWKKFVFTLIPLMIFMATLEIILRWTLPMQGGRVICFAPVLVRVYCPNVAGTVKHGVRISINSGAMIDREYPVEKTAGTTRVAVLGDSFTAGEAVEMGQRFHDLWEERIPKRTGARAEFLNFAGGGYSTWRQLQMFHLKTVKYKPDITILNLFWGNDIDDNIDRLRNGNYNPLKDEYPEFSLWNRVLVTRKNFNKWLWNRFITYQFVRQRYNILEQKVKGWLRRDRKEYKKRIKEFRKTGVDSESGKIPQGVKPGAMTVDTDSIFDDRFFADSEGMKLTRKLILKLNQEVKAAGGGVGGDSFSRIRSDP